MNNDLKEYIILGASGHGAVIADILLQCGCKLKGFLDDNIEIVGTEILGSKIFGKIEDCHDYKEHLFIVGIGNNQIRKKIVDTYSSLEYGIAIHPSAIIGRQVSIGAGTVIMAGSVVNTRTDIGNHCIINTRAAIDHDNTLGDFVHVSPGASLGGTVSVGDETHIGIGSCVRNNISICAHAVIGAGAVVVRNIEEPGVYVGVPARKK